MNGKTQFSKHALSVLLCASHFSSHWEERLNLTWFLPGLKECSRNEMEEGVRVRETSSTMEKTAFVESVVNRMGRKRPSERGHAVQSLELNKA